ncbi:RNA binding protein, partial [Zopfochytrium polystomum]
VRNLAYTVTVESLTELFSKYGEVTNSNIAKRKRGEKDTSKGYGGVTFASVKEATAAREALDGAEFEGRNISVHYAKAREE